MARCPSTPTTLVKLSASTSRPWAHRYRPGISNHPAFPLCPSFSDLALVLGIRL